MNPLETIKNKASELGLLQLITEICTVLPSNNDFRNLLGNMRLTEYLLHSGVSDESDYRKQMAKARLSCFFFLESLNQSEINAIHSIISGPPLPTLTTKKAKAIFFTAANPPDTDPIQIGYEYDKISQALKVSQNKLQWSLLPPLMAGTINNLTNVLMADNPTIVHFAGHGIQTGIYLATDDNKRKLIKTSVLTQVFASFKTECIFLNCCCSSELGEALSSSYAIGMNSDVADKSSVIFSSAFYGLLTNADSPDYEKAFVLSRAILASNSPKQAQIPEIWKAGNKLNL